MAGFPVPEVRERWILSSWIFLQAIRIARYLHPQAYLSAASAVLLDPTPDGRLFLSARRKQRTRIPSHQSVSASLRPSVCAVNTRPRLMIDMRASIAARLIEEYGSAQGASDAVWTLARENEWCREGEAALDLIVAWHGVLWGS